MARLRWSGNVSAQEEADKVFTKTKNKKGKSGRKRGKKNKKIKSHSYPGYLNSEKWKQKREEALKFYGNRCYYCGSEQELQVHHRSYARLGSEKMKDLLVLCKLCHQNLHGMNEIDGITSEYLRICKDL